MSFGRVAASRGGRRFAPTEEVVVPEFVIAVFGHRRFLLRLRHDTSLRRFVRQQQCFDLLMNRTGFGIRGVNDPL
jgi:hypothetical protein